jgi:hypothetical protein
MIERSAQLKGRTGTSVAPASDFTSQLVALDQARRVRIANERLGAMRAALANESSQPPDAIAMLKVA